MGNLSGKKDYYVLEKTDTKSHPFPLSTVITAEHQLREEMISDIFTGRDQWMNLYASPGSAIQRLVGLWRHL